ncbi:MAG: hypothetical protein R3E68_15115 [Burkholderiaceae bacterium]
MAELPATLAALRDAVGRRDLSPQEAVAAQCLRLARLDKTYHCVVRPTPRADDPVVTGGPLTGVGLAHKDIFDTPGRHPGRGRDDGAAAPGIAAAAALGRLTALGACHLANLVIAPDACGAIRSQRPLHAPLRQSAADIGNGGRLVQRQCRGRGQRNGLRVIGHRYRRLGPDPGEATCGLLGLKTTSGLVPLTSVRPLAPSLDSVGLLASADDALLVLDAIADPGLLRRPAKAPAAVRAWLPEADLDPRVASVIDQFIQDWRIESRTSRWLDHQPLTNLAEIVLRTGRRDTLPRRAVGAPGPSAVEAVACQLPSAKTDTQRALGCRCLALRYASERAADHR